MNEPTTPVMFNVTELWVIVGTVPDLELMDHPHGDKSAGLHLEVGRGLLKCLKDGIHETSIELTADHCRLINMAVEYNWTDTRNMAVGKFLILKTLAAWRHLEDAGMPGWTPKLIDPLPVVGDERWQIQQLWSVPPNPQQQQQHNPLEEMVMRMMAEEAHAEAQSSEPEDTSPKDKGVDEQADSEGDRETTALSEESYLDLWDRYLQGP
jgi:hypothetical protein